MVSRQINARGPQTSDPIRNFRFVATFMPLVANDAVMKFESTVGFTSISGLAMSTEPIPYREGGYNTTVHQVPGQTTFSPVTFQRGVTIGTDQNYKWTQMLFRVLESTTGATSTPLNSNTSSFRVNVKIDVLNHPVPYSTVSKPYGYAGAEADQTSDDLIVARFRLYNAWPTSLAYSDLNAGDNALMVEQMTIVHEGMQVEWANKDGIGSGGTFGGGLTGDAG